MSVIDRVRQFIRQHALADAETRVVLAVSGGSDSIALACLLRQLSDAGDLQVAGIAHFNHQLRPSADEEEHFVRAAAAALGWPMFTERGDVAARARDERRSVEDAAHKARHEFFARAREHFRADVVALGHTRDDQAETFMLRLLRGAGARGLASMHPRHGFVVRPLLACRRADLRAFLLGSQIAFVEDESNADTSIPRNRVRAELIPLIEARFNPNIVNVLADEADIARETSEWLEELATDLLTAAARSGRPAGQVALDVRTLLDAPLAVRRLAIRRAMVTAGDERPITFAHVDSVLQLLAAPAGGRLDMPGHRVDRVATDVVLTSRPPGTAGRWNAEPVNPANAGSGVNLFSYPLSIPGEVHLAQARCVVSAEWAGSDVRAVVGNGSAALVRGDLCGGGLMVRNRRPGDRFSPVGLGGKKKLQDFFVDRHVAREIRDFVPLVVDETDRIVWVAGYGIDEAFRVTDPAQAVLILRLTQV